MKFAKKHYNSIIFTCAVLAYFFNELILKKYASGAVLYFSICYANDVLASLLMLSITNQLLIFARRAPIVSVMHTFIFVAICALFWEMSYLFLPTGGVFDLWDFAAYALGGAIYLALHRCVPA